MLDYIEKYIHKKIKIEDIAELIGISPVHINRLFTFAYGMSIAKYIRKRKLSESLSDLLQEKYSVLEIALLYGFEYEQSFTRAFKAEFGITPGQYRKDKPIVRITKPIYDFGIVCEHGLLFGPEIVMFPKIYLIGIEQKIPYRNSAKLAPQAALDFWDKHRLKITNKNKQEIFYGLTHHFGNGCKYTNYLTAVEADKTDIVPKGMIRDAFGGYPCVKFHYIGNHHYRELSQKTAKKMYQVIDQYFSNDSNSSHLSAYPKIHLEKINPTTFSKGCLLEWYAPIAEDFNKVKQ